MAKRKPTVSLNPVQMIPFDRLSLGASNVRRRKAGMSIEDLAEDIARRGLLQAINVRPIVDAEGNPTGDYEIPAGGRRYRACEHLVKSKRLAKDAPIPCVVRAHDAVTSAEEDSLAENTFREALHPLDQFHAFKGLVDRGLSVADVAARFFVPERIVLQRLRLTTVSPKLLDEYGRDEMTLAQLEAFSVTDDHGRQEQVWTAVKDSSYYAEPYHIRTRLAESKIRGSDKRVAFVGLDAYEAAGGRAARDLFSAREDMLIEDPDILERLVKEKLETAAAAVAGEGWKWVHADVTVNHNQVYAYGRLQPANPLSDEEAETLDALYEEVEALAAEWEDEEEEPEDVVAQRDALTAQINLLNCRFAEFRPDDRARAGAMVSIASDGTLQVERGYLHPNDLKKETVAADANETSAAGEAGGAAQPGGIALLPPRITVGPQTPPASGSDGEGESEDDGKAKPLSEALIFELSGHRTMALRAELGGDPDMAVRALLHAMVVQAMYVFPGRTCLELRAVHTAARFNDAKIAETPAGLTVKQRHDHWQARLPEAPGAVWDFLETMSNKEKFELLAHVTSLTANVMIERFSQRTEHVAQGDQLAGALGLDLVKSGWRPTAENYFGRVSKARIVEAVTEACGAETAGLIGHLKKGDMAREAERLVKPTGWLPEMLRARATDDDAALDRDEADAEELPAFLTDDESDPADESGDEDPCDDSEGGLVAAE